MNISKIQYSRKNYDFNQNHYLIVQIRRTTIPNPPTLNPILKHAVDWKPQHLPAPIEKLQKRFNSSSYTQHPNSCMEAVIDHAMRTWMLAH